MASDQAVHRVEERSIGRPASGQTALEVRGQGLHHQLEAVAEMPASQCRVVRCLQGDPPQGDMDPDVVAAPLKRVTQGVAGLFGLTGPPEFDPFFVVGFQFFDATRVDQLKVIPSHTPKFHAPGLARWTFTPGTAALAAFGRSSRPSAVLSPSLGHHILFYPSCFTRRVFDRAAGPPTRDHTRHPGRRTSLVRRIVLDNG